MQPNDAANDPLLSPLQTPGGPLGDEDFQQLETVLADLAERGEGIPTGWEYCDGFLTALVCCRRVIPPSEYFPVLFGGDGVPGFGNAQFRDEAQAQTFLSLWFRRWNQIAAALAAPVESLDDERALDPYVVDLRALIALAPEADRQRFEAETGGESLPAFAQYWALGFMDAVTAWADDWVPPRDRTLAREWDDALDDIAALLDDDDGPPAVNPITDDGPPTMSVQRLEHFGDALWAVYTLFDIVQEIGPVIPTVRKGPQPGRNDPCPCGSGKKYKKCCGAG